MTSIYILTSAVLLGLFIATTIAVFLSAARLIEKFKEILESLKDE